jgi:hypothetical protein
LAAREHILPEVQGKCSTVRGCTLRPHIPLDDAATRKIGRSSRSELESRSAVDAPSSLSKVTIAASESSACAPPALAQSAAVSPGPRSRPLNSMRCSGVSMVNYAQARTDLHENSGRCTALLTVTVPQNAKNSRSDASSAEGGTLSTCNCAIRVIHCTDMSVFIRS